MKNQIPSKDFKPSFELCSDGEYATRETMLECFPFDLQNNESSTSKNFIFNSWESIDQDLDGKLDFTEWKGYLFALGYINFKVIHHGFGGAEEFSLNEEETENLLDYAHAWLSTKSSYEDNRIFFDNLFKSVDIDKNPNNLTHLEAIRLFLAIMTKFMEK